MNSEEAFDLINPMKLSRYEKIRLITWISLIILFGSMISTAVNENKYVCKYILSNEKQVITINALNSTQLQQFYEKQMELIKNKQWSVKNGS